MKKLNNAAGILSLLLVLLAVANVIILARIKTNLVVAEPPEWLAGMVAIIIILMGLISVFNMMALFLQFRYFKQASLLRSTTFVIGFFSLFMLIVGVIMLQDIGQEWKAGFESAGEWNIVFFSQILQGVFGGFILLQVFHFAKQLNLYVESPLIEKDEAVFLTVHQIGIFSAGIGFLCMFLLKQMNVPDHYLEGLFVISSIVALIPYALAALYWLLLKRNVRISEWYDEKQFMDISRGALLTLIITVLLSTLMFVFMVFGVVPQSIMLWFPVYLCGTLLVFSLSNHVIANG